MQEHRMNEQQLQEYIEEYQVQFAQHHAQELAFYRQQPTIADAIRVAVLARTARGQRHPHQRRLKGVVLEEVRQNMVRIVAQLEQSHSFAAIIALVQGCAVHGFGELAVYDTALRLGVYRNQLPELVYLHAGTRKGAARLGLAVDREAVPMNELPTLLQELLPYQVEDFLCIYKEELGVLAEGTKLRRPRGCAPGPGSPGGGTMPVRC